MNSSTRSTNGPIESVNGSAAGASAVAGRPPLAQQAANPAVALLRGAVSPAIGAIALLAAVGFVLNRSHGVSVLVGGGIALIALVVGPALHHVCRRLDPSLVLGLAVLTYCLVMTLVWIGYTLIRDAAWLNGDFAAGGVLAVVVAWVAGYMWASTRLRQLLYDDRTVTAER